MRAPSFPMNSFLTTGVSPIQCRESANNPLARLPQNRNLLRRRSFSLTSSCYSPKLNPLQARPMTASKVVSASSVRTPNFSAPRSTLASALTLPPAAPLPLPPSLAPTARPPPRSRAPRRLPPTAPLPPRRKRSLTAGSARTQLLLNPPSVEVLA